MALWGRLTLVSLFRGMLVRLCSYIHVVHALVCHGSREVYVWGEGGRVLFYGPFRKIVPCFQRVQEDVLDFGHYFSCVCFARISIMQVPQHVSSSLIFPRRQRAGRFFPDCFRLVSSLFCFVSLLCVVCRTVMWWCEVDEEVSIVELSLFWSSCSEYGSRSTYDE